MSEDFDAATGGLGDGRRAFLKKMAIGTAFTVPVVSSFTMAGIQAVYAQTPIASGQVSANSASNNTTTSSPTTTSTTTGNPTSHTTPTTTQTTTISTQPNSTVTTLQPDNE